MWAVFIVFLLFWFGHVCCVAGVALGLPFETNTLVDFCIRRIAPGTHFLRTGTKVAAKTFKSERVGSLFLFGVDKLRPLCFGCGLLLSPQDVLPYQVSTSTTTIDIIDGGKCCE